MENIMHKLPKKDEKWKTRFQPEPLCLFYFPKEVSLLPPVRKNYVSPLPKREPQIRHARRKRWKEDGCQTRSKGKDETWQKTEKKAPRLARRPAREPVGHLKSYLLSSVNHEPVPKKTVLPSLYEVLETVKDAWPTPPRRNLSIYRQNDSSESPLTRKTMLLSKGKMKEEMYLQFPSPLINRRFSVPEELMRKYFITKEKTSEESDPVKTMDELTATTTTSSSTVAETARRRPTRVRDQQPETCHSTANQKTAEENLPSDAPNANQQHFHPPRRVTQADYYAQGKSVIRVKETSEQCPQAGTCMCMRQKLSPMTKEETDDSPTTESVTSSDPVQLPKRESPSDLLSSESECVQCTCRELTSSKETSTDLFRSGNSTLSQTVSDKTVSTQDSTVSVRSVSTRGSTVTDNSNTTTPDFLEKTSAKETTTTTTTSDSTPRTPIHRNDGFCCHQHHENTCPRYLEIHHSHNRCPVHSNRHSMIRKTRGTNTDLSMDEYYAGESSPDRDEEPCETCVQHGEEEDEETGEMYTWAKLSHEELYMMQQLRHQKLMEIRFLTREETEPETCDTITLEYENEAGNVEQSIMIPRYSALPRSLSMLVNTSSGDNSVHNSDSDNQSLPDSLEDQPTAHVRKFYFDTKNESKPVRGEVSLTEKKLQRVSYPKGKAFFVSMKDPFKEDQLSETIKKVPEPPERVRNHIDERHFNLNNKHKHSHENLDRKMRQKKRKGRSLSREDSRGKPSRMRKSRHRKTDEGGDRKRHPKSDVKSTRDNMREQQTKQSDRNNRQRSKQPDQNVTKNTANSKKEYSEAKARFSSKIPVLVSTPERDVETSRKQPDASDNASQVVETTQILQITKTDKGVSLQPPHQVQQPVQTSLELERRANKNHLIIPPILPNVRTQPPFRLPSNRPMIPGQSRRSPVPRYRHRFEVIPEEKSSSLSSADEKTAVGTLPKFANAGTSPLPAKEDSTPENSVRFESYNLTEMPNLILAQVEDKRLQTLPYLKGPDEQKIILFSSKPQNSNSSKGRDALIAMNREDFNRLAKGWMNFYKLRENADVSDSETKGGKENRKKESRTQVKSTKEKRHDESNSVEAAKSAGEPKWSNQTQDQINNTSDKTDLVNDSFFQTTQKHLPPQQAGAVTSAKGPDKPRPHDVDDKIRFHSSNTILRTVKTITPTNTTKTTTKTSSLPDLNLPAVEGPNSKPFSNALPNVKRRTDYSDTDSDSDSTDYMEPPSPRVPPLPLEDFPSDATISSSESEFDDGRPYTTANAIKPYQFKKRPGTNRTNLNKETSRKGNKRNPGWSVTVAGTVELSRSTPDLEMRLSFPLNGGPPVVCQSDSGFTEDSYSKQTQPPAEPDPGSSEKDQSVLSANSRQKWTVTVQNNKQGNHQNRSKVKSAKNPNHPSPDLESAPNRNSKKVFKKSFRKLIARKLYALWPRVQKVIQEEFDTEDYRLMTEFCATPTEDDCLLSVRGTSILLEKKEKPLTMTERDVTKRYTARQTQRV